MRREPRYSRRLPPPTYRYKVEIFKQKRSVKVTSIRARNDGDAEVVAQKLMDWEGGDSVTVTKQGTA